jgi:hypothetical protein
MFQSRRVAFAGSLTVGQPQPLMRVRLNGQPATVYAIEPTGEATAYTVVLGSDKAPKKFLVPPARVERIESS